MNRVLLIAAALVGIGIAYVDLRPHWDDAGITAFSMLISAALFTLIPSMRPWLVALAIGIWIPAYALLRSPSLSSLGMLVVIAFPMVGAYGVAVVRRFTGGTG